jgi:hypothetical protein
MSALANVRAYAAGGYTHMYIANRAFIKINDEEIRRTIGANTDAYYLGAHFPDAGQISGTVLGLGAKIAPFVPGLGLSSKVSGKSYGEITHWDDFLDEYKNVFLAKYKTMTDKERQTAFAFILGVATHRVSDDIWHTKRDNPQDPDSAANGFRICGEINGEKIYKGDPRTECVFRGEPPYADWTQPPTAEWKFKTCDKSRSPFCYYGFIAKLRDLDAIEWSDAHTAADTGIDLLVYNSHRLPFDNIVRTLGSHSLDPALDIAAETIKNLDLKRVNCLDKETGRTVSCNPLLFSYGKFDVPTRSDIIKDFTEAYNWVQTQFIPMQAGNLPVTGVLGLSVPDLISAGNYANYHIMDWARSNYETDPDVGIDAIAAHVAKCNEALGTMLKSDAGSQKVFRNCEVKPKR